MTPKLGMEPIRRAQVINAALDCIADLGFEELTMDSVAERAGVSKGILNYYFKSKNEMLVESFKAFFEYYNQKVEAMITPEMTAEEMLDIMLEFTLFDVEGKERTVQERKDSAENEEKEDARIKISEKKVPRLFVHLYSRTLIDPQFQRVFREAYKKILWGMKLIINYGIKRGEFRKVDYKAVSYALMALCDGIILYSVLGFKPVRDSEIKRIWEELKRSLLK